MDRHPPTQEDDNWPVTTGFRRHNSAEAGRGLTYSGRTLTQNSCYNANRGSWHKNERKDVVSALNMNDLKKIHQMESVNDVLQTLSSRANMLKLLLNEQRMSNDVLEILLRIFVRVFECKITNYNVSEKRKTAIDLLKDSTFFKSVLQLYIAHLGDSSNTKTQSQIEEKVALLSTFLRVFIPGLECKVNDLEMHITLLDATSKALFVQRNLSKEAVIEVARLKKEADKCITEAKEEEKKRRQHASAIREGIVHGPPPNDYRDIPILPTKDDLHSIESPFLRPNKTKGSYSNHYHYLDVQFRLLREDFIGPLRDGIQRHLTNVANPLPRDQRKRNPDVRLYYDVQIDHPVFSENGVHYRVKFSLSNLPRIKWQNTKRLIFGSLVCLSHDNFQTLLFGTVGNREEDLLRRGRVDLKLHNIENMVNTRVYTMVESTAFFESYRPVLQVLQQFNEEYIPMENYIIWASQNIEQPKYLRNKNSVMYDITSLMKEELGTQDRRWLRRLQNAHKIDILDDNAWPALKKLSLDESQLSAVKAALTKELSVIQGPPGTGKTYIGLKIVETLLRNKSHWSPNNDEHAEHKSPIMVICYTNHALDQFLEGILKFSPKNLVRIGGRSKSEELARFNLKTLSKKYRHKSDDFQTVIDALSYQMIQAEEMIKLCNKYILSEYTLEAVINDNHFRCLQDSREEYLVDGKRSALPAWLGLLSTSHEFEKTEDVVVCDDEVKKRECGDVPNTKNLMTEVDMLMYQRAYDDASDYETRKKSILRDLYTKLAYDPTMKCKDSPLKEHHATLLKQLSVIDDETTEQEADRLVNIRRLSLNNRWRLYRYWITQYKCTLREMLFKLQHDYDQLVGRRIYEQDHEAKCKVIRESVVVGMTTTGAAMNKELLNAIRPKIVIVEEAAEILEAHIVTSLTDQCEHLILIGDHQQLKPSSTVYKLAAKFHLDTSLFERMVTNDVPCQRLSSQHRMRPEISNIMRRHFYSHLLDDESVNHFDDIMGVSHNLFFINHDFKEETVEDMLSKSNVHEAEYCLALAKYFFQQGYQAADIAILATYRGQVLNLKEKLRDEKYACLEGIYVSAVDNYQGEENDIILVSLVRSNEAGNIGFLKVSNRMCVALSRARKGLFCIGNFTLLAGKNDLWMRIVNDMRSSGRIGNHLQLNCHNHPKTKVKAFIAKDFEKCPLGGCDRMCEIRLKCGHVCPNYCHPNDTHHEKYECREPCVRTCDRGHPCSRRCFQNCLPCKVIVSRTLNCSHEAQIPCAKFNEPVDCSEPCGRKLQCGHKCKRKCYERCLLWRCLEIVNKSFNSCGHDLQVKCYIDVCPAPCENMLSCGHGCKNKCGESCTNKCTEIIDKTFTCGHTMNVPCFTPSCRFPCSREKTCGHPCPNICCKSCGVCYVRVTKELKCGHKRLMYCYEDVNRVHCRRMCSKQLSCGHQCKLLCYESCSSSLCTEMVKKKLNCGHDKEVPCNINPEMLNSRLTSGTHLYNTYADRGKEIDLIKCTVGLIVTYDCMHVTAIECWKSSTIGETECQKMCSRFLQCGHQCKELCVNPCTVKCTENVEKKLKCGHIKTVRCYVDVTEVATKGESACQNLVKVTRKCGHEITVECCKSSTTEETKCQRKVVETLSCKHDVIRKCSQIGICTEMCSRLLPCGHLCKEPCVNLCTDQCNEKVDKKLMCGHTKTVRCYVDVTEVVTNDEAACQHLVNVTHECGHEITVKCCELSTFVEKKCQRKVIETLSCKHYVIRECSEIGICTETCSRLLPCGHPCKEPCVNACTDQCNEKVDKKLMCGHTKTVRCYVDVTEMVTKGEAACHHLVNVTRECGHELTVECCELSTFVEKKCQRKVVETLSCKHDVIRECSEIGICTETCSRLLPCGHQCKEPCVNTCTDQCNKKVDKKLVCGHTKTVRCYVDVTEMVTKGEAACQHLVNVTRECGHEITVECCESSTTEKTKCSKWCSKKLPRGRCCTVL
ncbi:NFX1-type zinc finger-containing protein 1-like [Anneissia japonica]|uniref:NFX1-type zinc finger-containing protein 1-like n=1 Tax=Anneissia japonica TaxID=1529436 RepID=UPI0014257525|nr:NFX1-type zinc finger-containing protein 1-like [Anneissia japonica]